MSFNDVLSGGGVLGFGDFFFKESQHGCMVCIFYRFDNSTCIYKQSYSLMILRLDIALSCH